MLGVGRLGAGAAGGAEDLFRAEPFARATEKLDDQRLERAAPLERDLPTFDAKLVRDGVDDEVGPLDRRGELRRAHTGDALRGRDVDERLAVR